MERAKEILKELESQTAISFTDLKKWMIELFGEPRSAGSHWIFKMPWAMDPRINLQEEKGSKDAKKYQVKQCRQAVEKLIKLQEEKAAKEKKK